MARLLLLLISLGLLHAGEMPPAVGAGPPASYRLFPGDRIAIVVFGHVDLLVDTRVPASGELSFPLIGDLTGVTGRTPEEVAQEITRRLADGYIRNPSVQVQVREYGERRAFVIGSVAKPGTVLLDPLRNSSALQAIGAAGGFTDDADRGTATLLRADPQRPGLHLSVTLTKANAADTVLLHGDVILVPRADRVFVLGQVQQPQAVPVPSAAVLTVSKAISLAGGFGRYAKESKVQLVRPGEAPSIVDVRAVLDGEKDAVDPQLRAGDTVFVPETRF